MTHTFSCIGWQCLDISHAPSHHATFHYANIAPPDFSRAHRPAIIPSECSLSVTDTKDLVKKRTQLLPLPNLDPDLLKDIMPISSNNASDTTSTSEASVETAQKYREPLPTSDCDLPADIAALPPTLARHSRHRDAWVKARIQRMRNRKLEYFKFTGGEKNPQNQVIDQAINPKSEFVGPKRKHSTFVQELDYKCFLEDHAGTPHISNLFPDEDVSGQLNVEELIAGGEIAAVNYEAELVGEAAAAETEAVMDISEESTHESCADCIGI